MLIVSYPCDETFLDRAPFPVQIETKLLELDRLLEDPKLLLQVTNDLAQSAPQAWDNGRPSTPAEVTLRMSVVRRLMGWSYETAYQEIQGDVKWRWFCRIYAQPVPSDSTQQAREALIRPETLQHLNQRLLRLAHAAGVTQGRKLRMDGTVIETHIHYPTDSRLLADSARVLGRLLSQARKLLDPQTVADKRLFRNRARQAKRLARQIGQQVRTKKGQKVPENKAQRTYRRLLKVVQALLRQVAQVEPRLRDEGTRRAIQLAESLAHYVPLVHQVMGQTTRRVLEGRPVAARDKLVSLFEPHTAIIQRGKSAPNETEFGRKLWYSEVDGGLISEYRILPGNPPEAAQWAGSLQHHRKVFGHPPELATADRGVFSPLERRTGQATRREASGAAATGGQEWSPAKTRSPAVVQSGAPLSEWNRRPHQRAQAGAPTRPLSESRREGFGTLDRLGHHHQQFGRHGGETSSSPPFTQMIASGFPDEN
jgi:transposase, IS5 family